MNIRASIVVLAALLAVSLVLNGCGRKSDLAPPPHRLTAAR